MGGCRDLGDALQQLDVRSALVEVVVAYDAAEGLAARGAVLILVDLLEERALIPGAALELLDGLLQILLADVEHADLERLAGLCVADEIGEPSPCALKALEVLVVDNLVDLGAQLGVKLGDNALDGLDGVAAHDVRALERLGDQRPDGSLHRPVRLLRLRLELLVDKLVKIGKLH